MQYTKLGHTGLTVSRLCLGMMTFGSSKWRPWVLDEEASRPIFRQAVEAGINFFDTADVYSAGESEKLTGRFVKEFCRREEVVVATKIFNPVDIAYSGSVGGAKYPRRPNMDGLSRKRIRHAVDHCLERLGTDYIDLLQIHRSDRKTPIEETMEALHEVVKAGKALYIGGSNMDAWEFAKAQQVAKENGWTRFVSMQDHYNLAYREEEREMIPLCRDQKVAILPWSPLARGFLAGNRASGDKAKDTQAATSRAATDDIAHKYYYRDSDFAIVERLSALAQKKGVTAATLAYAWLHHKQVCAPIVGISKSYQFEQAIASLDVKISPEEMRELEELYEPHPVLRPS